MAVWTPGSYMVRGVLAQRGGRDCREAGRPRRAGGEDRQEPLASRNRRRRSGHRQVPAVCARDERAHQLGRGRFRDDQRRADVPDAGGWHPRVRTRSSIEPARGWRLSMTALPELPGGAHRYRAPDYDTLVDSPIIVGNPAVHEFTVDDKRHSLVNVGEAGVFDGARAAQRLETIVRAHSGDVGLAAVRPLSLLNVLTSVPGQIPGGGPRAQAIRRSSWPDAGRRARVRAIWRGSSSRATSSSMPGTASGCVRWSLVRSTTRRKSSRAGSGSWRA